MPELKHLTCNLKWAGTGTSLSEYGTAYYDGYVQTYVAVPETPTPFSIRLTSTGYIAPGLAMFVYIDGVYQCNRNRRNLRFPDRSSSRRLTEIDFHVRQKEVPLPDGSFLGTQWRFEKLKNESLHLEDANKGSIPNQCYNGSIEVIVLRCRPSPQSKRSASRKRAHEKKDPSGRNERNALDKNITIEGLFDGASDDIDLEWNDQGDMRRPSIEQPQEAWQQRGVESNGTNSGNVRAINPDSAPRGSRPKQDRNSKLQFPPRDQGSIPEAPPVMISMNQGFPRQIPPLGAISGSGVSTVDSWASRKTPYAFSEHSEVMPQHQKNSHGTWRSPNWAQDSFDADAQRNKPSQGDESLTLQTQHGQSDTWNHEGAKRQANIAYGPTQKDLRAQTTDQRGTNHEHVQDFGADVTKKRHDTINDHKTPTSISAAGNTDPQAHQSQDYMGKYKTLHPSNNRKHAQGPQETSGHVGAFSTSPNSIASPLLPTIDHNPAKQKVSPIHSTQASSPTDEGRTTLMQGVMQDQCYRMTAPLSKQYWTSWKGLAPASDGRSDEVTRHQQRLGLGLKDAITSDELALQYTHKISSPDYLDSHEIPYAIFVFKYRSETAIEHMMQTKIAEPAAEEKNRLRSLSKDEIINRFLCTKNTPNMHQGGAFSTQSPQDPVWSNSPRNVAGESHSNAMTSHTSDDVNRNAAIGISATQCNSTTGPSDADPPWDHEPSAWRAKNVNGSRVANVPWAGNGEMSGDAERNTGPQPGHPHSWSAVEDNYQKGRMMLFNSDVQKSQSNNATSAANEWGNGQRGLGNESNLSENKQQSQKWNHSGQDPSTNNVLEYSGGTNFNSANNEADKKW